MVQEKYGVENCIYNAVLVLFSMFIHIIHSHLAEGKETHYQVTSGHFCEVELHSIYIFLQFFHVSPWS
jgi:hypothetical protein